MPVDPAALDVDLLSLSGHKCYGPKGSGALYARWGTHLDAQLDGGGQERGRRSGTENVCAIVGFAAAAALVEGERVEEALRQQRLRDAFDDAVLRSAPGTRIAGRGQPRLPHLSALLVDGASGDALVTALDGVGVEVSGGSACASGAAQPSHVLVAMGEDPRATALLRISLGRETSAADMGLAAERIAAAIRVATSSRPGALTAPARG
jgi:cysteine desulfurase